MQLALQHDTIQSRMGMAGKVRVALIDDHKVLTDALAALLRASSGVQVVAEISDTAQIRSMIRRSQPTVIVVDLEMPSGDPLEAVYEAISTLSNTRVIVLTAFATDSHIFRANQKNVAGFLTKNEPAEAVVSAVHAVAAGHAMYSDEVRTRFEHMRSESGSHLGILSLSPRELHIVRLVAQGLTNSEIANQIFRSPKTVDVHISSALTKTECRNRVDLTRWAVREGLVSP